MRVKDRVENILKLHQAYRNSDKLLLLKYWKEQGLILSKDQMNIFLKCTPSESITRARRDLREEYPGSDTIEKKRFERFEDYKNNKAVAWEKEY